MSETTHKRLRVRLYPTEVQKKVLKEHFDAYRYSYNLCLEYKKEVYFYYTSYEQVSNN